MKIGIIGTGVFSTSIALLLANNKENQIILWSENENLVEEYKKNKKLNSIFKEKTVPKNITVTNSYDEALDQVEIVFLMTSVNYLDDVCKDIKHKINPLIPVCIGTKGIANDNKKMVHEIVHKHLKNKFALLSGPTFANDVAKSDPIGFVLACKDKKTREIIHTVFSFHSVFIKDSTDFAGVAICGCIKNIYAIGSGILSGLGYHESTNALYLTKVYDEIGEILYKYKSSLETFHSLACFGDLLVTCTSNQSRNYTYGEKLGKNGSKKALEKYRKENTIEGISTLEVMHKIIKRKHLKCPILDVLYKIVFQEESPKILIEEITKISTK